MYCGNCGKENAQETAFCTACGKPLGIASGASAEPARSKKPDIKSTIALILSAVAVVLVTLSVTGVFYEPRKTLPAPVQKGSDITASTIEREPLPKGSVNETGYYSDETGLLEDESGLLPGLIYFYDKTGVQPYVCLIKSVNGSEETPEFDDLQAFAESKYNELFNDGSHLLLVIFENNYLYRYWYTVGPKAKSVIDREAGNILGDYIEKYYDDDSLTYEQFLNKVFKMTADRIMSVTKPADQ